MTTPDSEWSNSVKTAHAFAQLGRFDEMLAVCQGIINAHGNKVDPLLDVGALLLNFGYLSLADNCCLRAFKLAPDDFRAVVNLANLARDAGDHAESRRLYAALRKQLPHHPVIRRNALVSLEYDPLVPDDERLVQACAWGEWATLQAGGFRKRPTLHLHERRPLRIGYVSADFCQHTVGLLVKDVLAAHDTTRVTVFAYSAGQVKDWVTGGIKASSQFRDVAAVNDLDLAALIRKDEIDLLVDLSGHTAGSRLTVFAHRPAPVQVSWLGYFATTGLLCMDAVLLDAWHAPEGFESRFVESIIRLPRSRFCYKPVPYAPEVSALPCLRNGYITFGCFNNTGKLNGAVFDAWAQILQAVPDSRLVLKWRTFADEAFCQTVWHGFAQRGITSERVELRSASFHVAVLREYAAIDIALDPFPFTGGLTSCEALWMGVPVITWPQSRVVSRQTFALLGVIDLPGLVAQDADDYVRIAVELASDRGRLATLRSGLRERMQKSPLMDNAGFTRQLEQTLIDLYHHIQIQERGTTMTIKTVLHVGCGHRDSGAKLPPAFQIAEWKEVRFDIDPANAPDIVGSMLDMTAVASERVDAVYSAHNIEHAYAHEVAVVLKEFLRVLKPQGYLVVTCPDLQAVAVLVAEDKLSDPAYHSPAGPITPLDMLYGHGAAIAAGHHYMAYKCGFTLKTLTLALTAAGFQTIAGKRCAKGLDLWVVASKMTLNEVEIRELAEKVLPG
ncbi:MAG: methyltransferase domain-containing protein [Nitrosomonas sp.]|nr:methyltransferase domain-containing protein [Nitrosomonas sp.]MDP1950322.1 methyltransferase domain-containing protein [Nitrosomonas sp.]